MHLSWIFEKYSTRPAKTVDDILSSSNSGKWFLPRCRCKYGSLLVRKVFSVNIHVGEIKRLFSHFVVAISFLREESYPIPFVPRVLSSWVKGRRVGNRGKKGGRARCKPGVCFLFIVLRKCTPYTQIKFVPGVRFACAMNFTGEDAAVFYGSLRARSTCTGSVGRGGFRSFPFVQFFVKM